MSIALQHLQSLVAGDGGHLHGVQALLEEAAGGFVAEVVEVQILNDGVFSCPAPSLLDRRLANGKDAPGQVPWQAMEHGNRSAGEGGGPVIPIFGVIKHCCLSGKVDVFPAKIQKFPQPAAVSKAKSMSGRM